MKLAVSNIAWTSADDPSMLPYLAAHGITGLEIAPTRIFPDAPYGHIAEACGWAAALGKNHHLAVASMQSIWHARTEALVGTEDEHEALRRYT